MVPTARSEGYGVSAFGNQRDTSTGHDLSDTGDARASKRTGDPRCPSGWDSKEQAVIFATVKSKRESVEPVSVTRLAETSRDNNAGNLFFVDTRTRIACPAQPGKISRKAVGEIHHRRHQPPTRKPAAEFDARLRVKLRNQQAPPARRTNSARAVKEEFQAQLRGTKCAGNENRVPGPRGIAPHGATSLDLADHSNAKSSRRIRACRTRYVAAGQSEPELARRLRHPCGHPVEPDPGARRGQCEAEKKHARARTHGGDIAGGAGQRLVAYGAGRMRAELEMDVLEKLIAGEHAFGAGSKLQHSRIVANAETQSSVRRGWNTPPYALNNFIFA
jgi:hypothetical protein